MVALCFTLRLYMAKADSLLQYLTLVRACPIFCLQAMTVPQVWSFSTLGMGKEEELEPGCTCPPLPLAIGVPPFLEQSCSTYGISECPRGRREGNALLFWKEEVSNGRRGQKRSSPKSSAAHRTTSQHHPWWKNPGAKSEPPDKGTQQRRQQEAFASSAVPQSSLTCFNRLQT